MIYACQLTLAQNDAEVWLNLLVIILFAVFAILGKFLKSTAQKMTSDQEDTQRDRQRPWKIAPPGQSRQKPAKTAGGFQPRMALEKHSRPAPKRTDSQARLSQMQVAGPAERDLLAGDVSPRGVEIVSNLQSPDTLRNAVLYAEILGKPAALKNE